MIYITLRFDDGTISQYTHAFKYMKEFNMPGTIYVIGSKLTTQSYVKIQNCIEMQDCGWEIGYHSWSHNKDWIDDPKTYYKETDVNSLLSKGLRIETFSLPYSVHNREVISYLSNYKGIVGIPTHVGNSMNRIPDNKLFTSYTITNSTKYKTILDRIMQAIEANEYLILLFHKIEKSVEKTNLWSIPLKRFKKIIRALDALQKRGLVQVLTFSNAIDFIAK